MIIESDQIIKGSLPIDSIIHGKSEEVLSKLPDSCISTVISDPPYGLRTYYQKTIETTLLKWLQGDDKYIPGGKGFRNSDWDSFVPPPYLFKQVLRVMKPGATALIFAGSRTQDIMAMSMRLAGFEIKDTMFWIYGNGFAKGIDISKGIDKKKGFADERGYIETTGGLAQGTGNTVKLYTGKQLSDKGYCDEAKIWEGYNSSLKPAYEPIIVAIKPCKGGYVTSALKHGVSGFNIKKAKFSKLSEEDSFKRYPSNIIVDKSIGYKIDKQHKGCSDYFKNIESDVLYCPKASPVERNIGLDNLEPKIFGCLNGSLDGSLGMNTNRSNFHPTVKPLRLMQYLVDLTSMPSDEQVYLDMFLGSGTTALACVQSNKKFIGIEQSEEFCGIADARVDYARMHAIQRKI